MMVIFSRSIQRVVSDHRFPIPCKPKGHFMAKNKPRSTTPPSGTPTLNAKRLESENRKLSQKNELLNQRNRELELIGQSFLAINSSLELGRVLSKILKAIKNLFGVVGSSIWLKDHKTGEVVCRRAAGFQRAAAGPAAAGPPPAPPARRTHGCAPRCGRAGGSQRWRTR